MVKKQISAVFFFALFALTFYGIGRLLFPFAGAILSAFCLAVVFHPLYRGLRNWKPRWTRSIHAFLTVVAILIVIVVPVSLLVWTIVSESQHLSAAMQKWGTTVQQLRQGDFSDTLPWMRHVRWWMHRTLGLGPEEFRQRFVGKFAEGLSVITAFGAGMAQHTLNFLFDLFVMLFTLFFFLRDGEDMNRRLERLAPLPRQETEDLVERVHGMIIGVVRGWFLTSVVQGACATVGYFIVNVEGAVLLGVLTAISGLLPVIGTLGVWVPVGIFLLIKGRIWKGVFILLWGAFIVVGLGDAFVRPYLVGRRIELPILYLFFALLGGVEVWGVKGVILGPLLVAIAPLLLAIYQQRYLRAKAVHEP